MLLAGMNNLLARLLGARLPDQVGRALQSPERSLPGRWPLSPHLGGLVLQPGVPGGLGPAEGLPVHGVVQSSTGLCCKKSGVFALLASGSLGHREPRLSVAVLGPSVPRLLRSTNPHTGV